MTSSIAIIGAGWYGCHIATSMRALGFETTIFEQHHRPMHEASGNNQFRLHLGFHYPRHHGTRMQSRDGLTRFLERYNHLSVEVPENIYAVPREDSLLDFTTYQLIMTSSGIDFREVKEVSVPLQNIEGMMLVGERVLLIDRARQHFMERLGPSLRLGEPVTSVEDLADGIYVNGERFDLLVDATWGHHIALPLASFFEPTLLLYYETDGPFPAVTLVDGPLCSIYPTEKRNTFTLSSVPHTPLARCTTAREARAIRDSVTTETIEAKRAAMEEQISRYVPQFRERFRFAGPQLSIKTKPIGNFDDRSCYVYRNGRTFSVMSGKIDTIFFATERILLFIEQGMSGESGGQAQKI
jgi:hypothetical protein